MGLPKIQITFQRLANDLIKRSERGIVLLILKDNKSSENAKDGIYKDYDLAAKGGYTEDNLDYIRLAFEAGAQKVIVKVVSDEHSRTLDNVLADSKFIFYNWLAMPDGSSGDNDKIIAHIKDQRKKGRMRKAIVANKEADNMGIVNFTTEEIKIKGRKKTYTAQQYTARVAGILSTLSLKRSLTYYVLPEIEAIKEIEDPDGAIDKGQLILINDGRQIKFGTGVNSLTTIPDDDPNIKKDMQKIKIVEGMDIIKTDIHDTFEDYYVGKYPNDYDHKVLFFTNVNTYFDILKKTGVLNPDYPAFMDIDMEAHKEYMMKLNKDPDKYSETQIKKWDTGDYVYARGNLRLLDAMENLTFIIDM